VWLWVFVFAGIALAGLIMLICYAVWLAHKTSDVMSELGVLGDRTQQMLDLLGQIEVPDVDQLHVQALRASAAIHIPSLARPSRALPGGG